MKRWITTAVTSATLWASIAGCTPNTPCPTESDAGAGGGKGEGTGGGTGSGWSGKPSAIAMRAASLQTDVPIFMPYLPFDPDTLVLFFASEAESCEHPFQSNFPLPPPRECTPPVTGWEFAVFIPPELDRVGTIDLEDHRILSFQGSWGNCGGAGWAIPGHPGVLTIDSSDATSLSLGIFGTATPADGSYTVARCDAAPAERPRIPGIAIHGASLPPPPDGGAVDPDALYFFLGASETCADPWSTLTCTGASRLTFTLPDPSDQYQEVDLTDPTYAARFAVSSATGAACTPATDVTTGQFPRGIVAFQSLDAVGGTLLVLDANAGAAGGFFDADGAYAVTICP